jgi:hypothetical protein
MGCVNVESLMNMHERTFNYLINVNLHWVSICFDYMGRVPKGMVRCT